MPTYNQDRWFAPHEEGFRTWWAVNRQCEDEASPGWHHPSYTVEDAWRDDRMILISGAQEACRTFQRYGNHANWKVETLWEEHDYDIYETKRTVLAHLEAQRRERGEEHRMVRHWTRVLAVIGEVTLFWERNEMAGHLPF